MVQVKWIVATCEDCESFFALDKDNEPHNPLCPNCGSEDIIYTGEYLDDSLYTENGKKIQ